MGRKSRAELFDDALRAHVTQLVADGATATAFDGPKPSMPDNWTAKVPIALTHAPAPPVLEHPAPPPEEKEQPKSKEGSKKGVKRGPYKIRSDEVKYLFWDLDHTTTQQTVDYVNANLATTFDAPLSLTTLAGCKKFAGWADFKQLPVPSAVAPEPQKRGSKKRPMAAGEFKPWNNRRVPVSVLMILATMVMSLINTGMPISSGTALTFARGLFSAKAITWVPKITWARTFMYRLGLKPRRGTRPARALPPDFETVQRLSHADRVCRADLQCHADVFF